MLTLIGLGLFDEKDLTLRGLEVVKKADKIYIELYTSKWHGNLKNLEKIIGQKIYELKRKDLEEESERVFEEAKNKNIVLLIQGDPLVATTHLSLITDARKLEVKTKIIHNASIISAIAETGLHVYNFGPTVTIPFPEKTKGKSPQSIYKIIKENKKRGLHTLCLLDVVAEENKYLSVNEAIKILLLMGEKLKGKVFTEETKFIVFCRAGSNQSKISYEKAKDLINRNFGEPPAILIIPGKLHFTENEYLNNL